MARRTEDCSLLGGAWFQVPVEERAGRTGARAAVLQRSVASHKSPAQRLSTSWASQGGFTTTAQRARGWGIWSALCRALGHPELCQLVSSHTKWEGRRGARGPLGPAFSVSAKLGVVVSDRDMPRPANAVILQPERARPLPPVEGCFAVVGHSEGTASCPWPWR